MNWHHLPGLVLTDGIGYAVVAGLLAVRRRCWLRGAHKLAARSGLALPPHLEGRVAGYLRRGQLLSVAAVWICLPLVTAISDASPGDGRYWARQLPWLAVAVPLASGALGYLPSLWPRWKASGATRVTHLTRLPVRQAFTGAEVTVAAICAGLAVLAGGWGLLTAAAPAWSWAAFAASCALAGAGWRGAAARIMSRPASAQEPGWDDLIRFGRVRGLTLGMAMVPAAVLFLAGCAAQGPGTTSADVTTVSVNFWPEIPLLAALVVVCLVFREDRQLWRRAWTEPGADPVTSR